MKHLCPKKVRQKQLHKTVIDLNKTSMMHIQEEYTQGLTIRNKLNNFSNDSENNKIIGGLLNNISSRWNARTILTNTRKGSQKHYVHILLFNVLSRWTVICFGYHKYFKSEVSVIIQTLTR